MKKERWTAIKRIGLAIMNLMKAFVFRVGAEIVTASITAAIGRFLIAQSFMI